MEHLCEKCLLMNSRNPWKVVLLMPQSPRVDTSTTVVNEPNRRAHEVRQTHDRADAGRFEAGEDASED